MVDPNSIYTFLKELKYYCDENHKNEKQTYALFSAVVEHCSTTKRKTTALLLVVGN
jgi:hypothetical protein